MSEEDDDSANEAKVEIAKTSLNIALSNNNEVKVDSIQVRKKKSENKCLYLPL